MVRTFLLATAILSGGITMAAAQDFHRVSVMAFNAENLFDTEDDAANGGDDTYLPLAVKRASPDHEAKCRANNDSDFYIRQCISLDWSEAVLTTKLNALAAVLTAASPTPDILIMPETENLAIVQRLNAALPEDRRYDTIVQLDTTSVTDDRGIDVAILSRFALSAPATAHPIDFGNDKELCGGTRDIIEAPLALPDGKVLHVFGVHFPSGSNPLICRQRAAAELNRIRALLPADALAIAGGDFNFNCSETQGALFERIVRHGKWGVPPAVRAGCEEPGSNKHTDRSFGTWFTWSYLDFFLVSENMLAEQPSTSGWFANLGAFRTLVGTGEQIETNSQGYVSPRRFDAASGSGVSDHWPVMIDLVSRP
ncbi:endonuclease/exonuclease/phosphatase family metal-dependent hydrolase (plasmid) [Ensifer sp. WSM1721]|uniref:endonuclease/exonuclease/phosphatase family protein n=1 Tax=Ensifer sp. WSM1721 TaxID=1041159 RepID=UPI0004AEF016|nr:endonuclease/exonuclease/phosphatase family protein [Ensifer sp. WSM1721]